MGMIYDLTCEAAQTVEKSASKGKVVMYKQALFLLALVTFARSLPLPQGTTPAAEAADALAEGAPPEDAPPEEEVPEGGDTPPEEEVPEGAADGAKSEMGPAEGAKSEM